MKKTIWGLLKNLRICGIMKLIPMDLIEEKKIARISKKEMKSIQRYL